VVVVVVVGGGVFLFCFSVTEVSQFDKEEY
jgi:hypothetical protein